MQRQEPRYAAMIRETVRLDEQAHLPMPVLGAGTPTSACPCRNEGWPLQTGNGRRPQGEDAGLLALHGRLQFAHSRLCLAAGHGTLEMSVLDVVGAAAQGGNVDREKGGSPFGRHLPDAVEITDAGGVKIEILSLFVFWHWLAPLSWITLQGRPPSPFQNCL